MKILIMGDTHNRPELLEGAHRVMETLKCDKLILMGDYMDDWDDSNESTLENLSVLDTIVDDPRVIALIGNHELSYLEDQHYGGWTAGKQIVFNNFFKRNKFALSFQVDNWLFTHAGLTAKWQKYASNLNIKPNDRANPTYVDLHDYDTRAEWLNALWDQYPGIYKSIGEERGGYGIGSPLWADWAELTRNPAQGVNQVVGHTPGDTIRHEVAKDGSQLWCVDVWSNHGPGGYMLWEDGNITILDSTGAHVVNPQGIDA